MRDILIIILFLILIFFVFNLFCGQTFNKEKYYLGGGYPGEHTPLDKKIITNNYYNLPLKSGREPLYSWYIGKPTWRNSVVNF